MATEVSFAKTFLAILDKQPQKLTPDHVEDPRNYPPTNPVCLLTFSLSIYAPNLYTNQHSTPSPASNPPNQ